MPKLIVMQGLPASGKSTEAEKQAHLNPLSIRINRDLLREMMYFGKYSPQNESVVFIAERILARKLLFNGFNVIIDDTNLTKQNMADWTDLANESKAKVEIEFIMMDTPVYECIVRDKCRKNPVGEEAIMKMNERLKILRKESEET